MKKILLVIAFVSTSFGISYAQQTDEKKVQEIKAADPVIVNGVQANGKITVTTNNQVYPIQLSASNIPVVTTEVSNNPVPEILQLSPVVQQAETVAHCDEMIAAIKLKIDWVRNHPIEHTKALESGWYKQMENTIAEYEMKKSLLLNQK
jgi:hypothetical protein